LKDGLISVIIPVWKPNISQLKECIDSVIGQTYSDLEIIIVYHKDSNYNDKFYDLIGKYNDPRLRTITAPAGISIARNTAVKNSEGQYIAFIDADDFCEKERFEKQLKFKKEKNCNVVGSWAYNISNDGKTIGKIRYPVEHEEIRKKFMLQNFILNPSALIDRKLFEEIGLYDTELEGSEDYDFWFRAMKRGNIFGNIPEYLIRLRENPDSLTRGKEWRKQRMTSMKVRNRAVFQHGFKKPRDIFYYTLTPFSFLISPRLLIKIKEKMGWHRE